MMPRMRPRLVIWMPPRTGYGMVMKAAPSFPSTVNMKRMMAKVRKIALLAYLENNTYSVDNVNNFLPLEHAKLSIKLSKIQPITLNSRNCTNTVRNVSMIAKIRKITLLASAI